MNSDVRLIGTDANPLAIGLYQPELFDKTYVIPRADDPGYWKSVERICQQHSIDYAVILPEIEVRAWSLKKRDGSLPCNTLVPELSLVDLLLDKAKMTSVLKRTGWVPPSVEFSRDEKNLRRLFTELERPFWVRSTSGTSGLGSLKIEDEESLRNWITINPGVSNFLASKYLPGRNLACKLLYFEGELKRAACAERVNYIMSKVAPSGITGNTSFGRLLNEPEIVRVATGAMEVLFRQTGTSRHGFFTIDFKEDENQKPFITEVNVRHVAFTQCFAAAGANFADDTIRLLANAPFSHAYRMYEFEKDLIFLRDVDASPILMKESDLLKLML